MDVAATSSATSSLTQEELPGQKLFFEHLGRHVPYDHSWHYVYQVQGESPWGWFDLDAYLSLQLEQQSKSAAPGVIEAALMEGSPLYSCSVLACTTKSPRSGKRKLLRRALTHIDPASMPV